MGELAEDKVDGLSCCWCGIYFEKEHGHPILCDSCWVQPLKKYGSAKEVAKKLGLMKANHKEL